MELLLQTFDDKEGDFLFLFHPERLFLLLFFPISSESELENVLCHLFLDFLFIWVLSSLQKILKLLLYVQPFQLALQVSLHLYLSFFHSVSLSEFTTRGIRFGWQWFSCSEWLFKLFCHIVETLLKLSWDINFHRILSTTARPFASRTQWKKDGGLGSTLGWASQAGKTQY